MRMCVLISVSTWETLIPGRYGYYWDTIRSEENHERTHIVVTVEYNLHIFKWSIKLLIDMVSEMMSECICFSTSGNISESSGYFSFSSTRATLVECTKGCGSLWIILLEGVFGLKIAFGA